MKHVFMEKYQYFLVDESIVSRVICTLVSGVIYMQHTFLYRNGKEKKNIWSPGTLDCTFAGWSESVFC